MLISKNCFCDKFIIKNVSTFVPKYESVLNRDIKLLENFIRKHNRILIVTGAGVSTESGIPDYRSEDVGLYARSNHKPIEYKQFISSPFVRQRYWARNYVGWPRFSTRTPNKIHHAITRLELEQKLTRVITQNVDNLHTKALTYNLIQLHGNAFKCICIQCKKQINRQDLQMLLQKLNPEMGGETKAMMIRPDGDVEIPQSKIVSFRIPSCNACGGIFKLDVVFFGENVPLERVNLVNETIGNSDSVLVLGTTLTTFSSYRIILRAHELHLPIGVINIGPTRIDDLLAESDSNWKISTNCIDILPLVCRNIFS